MSKDKSSYRNILKATSIFGGVQVFRIFIQIIKSKFVAILIGPSGIGIVGLFTSTIGLLGSMSNFGIATSAVKDVSEANLEEDKSEVSKIIYVVKKLVWLTGILGALLTIILSPYLSSFAFGNKNYTLAFVWLSVTLLFNQLTVGNQVILQGLRQLRYLANASLLGSLLGLVVTIPIYYYWRVDGIVPVIIITSISTFALTRFYANKLDVIVDVSLTQKDLISKGKSIMGMGFLISLSGFLTAGSAYLLKVFIASEGSIMDLGLYSAGFAIMNTYVGLVFTAMGTDYYPRLSEISRDNHMSKKMINQQAEISILIFGPILMIFIIYIKYIIIILYSSKFTGVNTMIYWIALGMFFKAASWAIAFIFLAKGNRKVFFWNELTVNIYMLVFNILGYKLYGLTGLGISFFIGYILYLIQVFSVAFKYYSFSFTLGFSKIFIVQFTMALLCYFLVTFYTGSLANILGTFLIILSTYYSYRELDTRMNIKELFNKIIKRK